MRHIPTILMLSTAILFLGVATGLFFGAESSTFYSPYSTEAVWLLKLPGGYERSIDAVHGLIALISSLVLAILFLTLAALRWSVGTGAASRSWE